MDWLQERLSRAHQEKVDKNTGKALCEVRWRGRKVGYGCLVKDPLVKNPKLSKYFIITTRKVITEEKFGYPYQVVLNKSNSKTKTFHLLDIMKSSTFDVPSTLNASVNDEERNEDGQISGDDYKPKEPIFLGSTLVVVLIDSRSPKLRCGIRGRKCSVLKNLPRMASADDSIKEYFYYNANKEMCKYLTGNDDSPKVSALGHDTILFRSANTHMAMTAVRMFLSSSSTRPAFTDTLEKMLGTGDEDEPDAPRGSSSSVGEDREHNGEMEEQHPSTENEPSAVVGRIKPTQPPGSYVNARDDWNRTPLMWAAENGALDFVKDLIKLGADPFAEDFGGWNSLHFAAQCDNPDLIEVLLNQGLDTESKNARSETPVMIAALNGNFRVVNTLKGKNAELLAVDQRSYTLLHFAAGGGNCEILQTLEDIGIDIETKGAEGMTPLMVATKESKLKTVEYLLRKGAKPSNVDANGWNSLHWASSIGSIDIIDLILEKNPKLIESKTKMLLTPLIISVCHNQPSVLEFLLKKGADPSAKDRDGKNALYHIPKIDVERIKKLLLKYATD